MYGGPVGSVRSAYSPVRNSRESDASTTCVQGFGEGETLLEAYLNYEGYISWKAVISVGWNLYLLASCCMYVCMYTFY